MKLVRLLPQSLFGRLLAALLTVVGITLVIVVILIVGERHELALWSSGASSAVRSIAQTSATLAQLAPEQRRAALQEYVASPIWLGDARQRSTEPRAEELAAMEKAFARQIRAQLGPQFSVSIDRSHRGRRRVIRVINEARPDPPPQAGRRPGRFLFAGRRVFDVTVALPDGERVVFRTAAPQPGPPLPSQIFIQLAILTVVLTLVLYVMTRNITRPLSALARAADAIGRGSSAAQLPEHGARELRDATRAFNTMQDRLRRYLDSRTRVLAAMSHDLRTPLTRMRLRTESIDDEALRIRFNADLDDMTEMVRGALSMFRDLNDTEAATAVDINALLQTLQREFAEMNASVTIEGEALGAINAKPNALKRCLTNLLRNAVDYGNRASVHLSDGTQLVIRIRDEGPGIPEEALAQVFEPYFRVEASRNRDSGGTGLGLSIARDIAQAHGGTIQLKNLPERGLEATLTLPR